MAEDTGVRYRPSMARGPARRPFGRDRGRAMPVGPTLACHADGARERTDGEDTKRVMHA